MTPGMSARDLRAICEVAERRWVAAIIRGEQQKNSLPPLAKYVESAEARKASLAGTEQGGGGEGLRESLAEQQQRVLAALHNLYAAVPDPAERKE
jgi:hypothetical protein